VIFKTNHQVNEKLKGMRTKENEVE